MTYLEWNNIISEFFFNTANAGKDIYLYLTRKDIISLKKARFKEETEEEIWEDFIKAIRFGLPGARGNIIAKAKYSYDKRNLRRIDSLEIKYPPYILYLVFFVLPLVEDIDGTYSPNNYYDRLNRFLNNNKINDNINTNDFRNCTINYLWDDLEYWANIKNNGDLGKFRTVSFVNPNWIYVGKIFSQCVFPPKSIKQLPELFLRSGMVPCSYYPVEVLRNYLLIYGSSILKLSNSTLSSIRNESNELGKSVINILSHEYRKWTGESHEYEENGVKQAIKRNYTIVPLSLQFKVNHNDELISFSFRAYSLNDYPEDLKFAEYDNLYEINGWSKTLDLDFKESFELKDDFNKWIARFPDRDVRLFVSAGTYQLSTDYWIETESLSKVDSMYLLCKNKKRQSLLEWGKSFFKGNFREEDLDGLPQDYSLFKILNPTVSHPDISLLTLYTEKRIELLGGLKVNFRTFINDFLPEVGIANSDGEENVYLQYRNTEDKIFLVKKDSSNNRWLLPSNILLNTDFYIKSEDENFAGNEIAYTLTSSLDTAINVDGVQLPKRDSFGRLTKAGSQQYCLGSNIVNPDLRSKKGFSIYTHLFTSNHQEISSQISKASFFNHNGNMLCAFLGLKNILTTEEFFKAFEFYYYKQFPETDTASILNLTRIKKSSLSFYDYTGILDYDYETKKIVLNPPQFIFIPVTKGRMVLLIGARDALLVEAIIDKAPKHKLQVVITKQFSSNLGLLLPDVITIKSFGKSNENYGESNLLTLADELGIEFSNEYFPQIALQDFSSTITEYENLNELVDENDYDWARRIFNPQNLVFERNESQEFDKSFSLIEYKLNEYTYSYKLWKDGKCYQVDKNWGKYLVLSRFNNNVILFDSAQNRVAIPRETPLPRLLSESIMLLSGLAPCFRYIEGRVYRIYENIPSIFTENLFRKLGQQPIKIELI